MTNQTNSHEPLDQRFTRTGVRTAFFALALMFSQVAQAVPILVDVYGAPYFTLPGLHDKDGKDNQWIVLGAEQGLSISLEDDQLSLLGRHDVSTHDRSGQSNQFSFVDMSVNLPGSNAVGHGFIDYLIGDRSGQFTLEQVIYRTPRGNDASIFSLFFWGIDYVNGAGLVLGMEASSRPNNYNVAVQVSEPSMVLLMILGMSIFRFSRLIERRA